METTNASESKQEQIIVNKINSISINDDTNHHDESKKQQTPPPPPQQQHQPAVEGGGGDTSTALKTVHQPPWVVMPYPPHYTHCHPHHLPPPQSPSHQGGGSNRSIWVGDLLHWMDEGYLRSCFASTGELASVKVIRNKQTGIPEGYGFVEFYTHEAAEKALQTYPHSVMPNTDQPFLLNWATFSKVGVENACPEKEDGANSSNSSASTAASVIEMRSVECKPSESSSAVIEMKSVECRPSVSSSDVVEIKSVERKPSDSSSDGVVHPGQSTTITIVISNGVAPPQPVGVVSSTIDLDSPRKFQLSRDSSSHEQCRVCQQEKEEVLIVLGCQCRGGLANAHRSCIETWFSTRGSNKCEICQQVAANVAAPEPQASTYWIWRMDPAFRGAVAAQERERGCFSPLWIAFSILIGGLLLDVLISITLGVSALPVNIIIGVIVVLGLGTALRLAMEFCHEWSVRRVVHRAEANVGLGYHPAL